jgi:hypothetical protein
LATDGSRFNLSGFPAFLFRADDPIRSEMLIEDHKSILRAAPRLQPICTPHASDQHAQSFSHFPVNPAGSSPEFLDCRHPGKSPAQLPSAL